MRKLMQSEIRPALGNAIAVVADALLIGVSILGAAWSRPLAAQRISLLRHHNRNRSNLMLLYLARTMQRQGKNKRVHAAATRKQRSTCAF